MFSFWSDWSLGKRGTATLSFGPLVRDEIVLADGAGDDALLITNALCVLFGGRALVGGRIPVDVRLDFTGGLYRSSSLAWCYTNRDYNVVTYDPNRLNLFSTLSCLYQFKHLCMLDSQFLPRDW